MCSCMILDPARFSGSENPVANSHGTVLLQFAGVTLSCRRMSNF